MRDDTADYRSLFLHDLPLLDVRAPVEFNAGAFPSAVNIPLLDDQQRELIGTRFKEAGQDAAIALGLELATPDIRAQRLADWSAFCAAHANGYLYCFRGGLRSRTTQAWLREAGVAYPLVRGGYKALRNFLLDTLHHNLAHTPLLVVSGATGVGKTALLRKVIRHVDLEALAKHRGSAFGHTLDPQPAQISWENAVAIALLKLVQGAAAQLPVLLEDEGRLIGHIHLPLPLQAALQAAPRVVLEAPLEERVAAISRDYVAVPWQQYQLHYGAAALPCFSDQVLRNLQRIRKRLGDERHARVQRLFRAGLAALPQGDLDAFHAGIRILLLEYYDPLYAWQLQQHEERIVHRGDHAAVLHWLQQRMEPAA
jgi:tRNA 2-selenouridine synthase